MDWPLISADSHYGVPFELVEEVPERYRQYLPRLEERDDGVYVVRPAFALSAQTGSQRSMVDSGSSNADAMTRALADGIKIDPDDDVSLRQMVAGNCCPAAVPGYTPEERISEMARDGVVGELLIGGGGFGATLPDPEANLMWCRIHNDWLAATYKSHFDRFAPSMMLPLHDFSEAARELERCAGLGLRPVALPDLIPGHPYHLAEWEPVWRAAHETRTPIVFHLTGAFGRDTTTGGVGRGGNGHALTAFAHVTAAGMITLGWLVNGGILERYPNLRIAMIECNASWLAYAMEQWDHALHGRYTETAARTGVRDADLGAPPSYFVRRQVKCQFMWDPQAVKLRHDIGLDVLMWGNDYPHMEGAFPDSARWIEKQFAGVPEAETMKILHDNAADFLGLTV